LRRTYPRSFVLGDIQTDPGNFVCGRLPSCDSSSTNHPMALRCRERTITRKSRLDSAHFEPAGGRPATVTEALSACRLLMRWTAPGLSNRAASSRVQNASGSSHQSSQIKQVARPASDAQSNESPATVGLCFRETGLWGAETVASERAVRFNLSSAETKRPDENPPVRHYLHDTGKSLFVWDCVVGLRGLELPTKRLSAVSSDH
jgi:hypothetical protein